MLSMRTRFSVSDVHHHNGFSVQFEYVSFPCYLGEPSTCNGTETRENRCLLEKIVEARVGIEPTYKGFADLSCHIAKLLSHRTYRFFRSLAST